jgi:hypothetical protein
VIWHLSVEEKHVTALTEGYDHCVTIVKQLWTRYRRTGKEDTPGGSLVGRNQERRGTHSMRRRRNQTTQTSGCSNQLPDVRCRGYTRDEQWNNQKQRNHVLCFLWSVTSLQDLRSFLLLLLHLLYLYSSSRLFIWYQENLCKPSVVCASTI